MCWPNLQWFTAYLALFVFIALPAQAQGPGTTIPLAMAVDSNSAASKASNRETAPFQAVEIAQADMESMLLQLGSPQSSLREQAEANFLSLGAKAFDVLEAGQAHEDPEIAERSRYLLSKIEFDWVHKDDTAPVRTLMDQYRRADDTRRVSIIDELFRMQTEQAAAALARIVRNDMAPELSAYAAAALIDFPWENQGAAASAAANLVRQGLSGSRQIGAEWVRARLSDETDPIKRWNDWQGMVDARLKTSPGWTDAVSAAATASLLHHLRSLAEKAGKTESLPLVDEKILQTYGGSTESWYVVSYNRYYKTAGLYERAEREFRGIIRVDAFQSPISFFCSHTLGELLHDQEKESEAGNVFLAAVDAVEKSEELKQAVLQQNEQQESMFNSTRSRGHYCLAMGHLLEGRMVEHRKELDTAIKADPKDADVLIALHRLPEQDDERRSATTELIRQAAEDFESKILAFPDDDSAYNQYAWLIGNTLELSPGDWDKAIGYSQKSIELSNRLGENPGGHYDTLAHCFAAKGDYAKAVQAQARAAEYEPHSKQIRRKLELFKKKLAETKEIH